MKDDSKDISNYRRLLQLKDIFARVKQISWNASSTEKRYPGPEAMTPSEMEELTRTYLALGYDIEELAKEWKELKKQYDNVRTNTSRPKVA